MELKDFIKTALLDIVQAIEEAQTELGDKSDYICPIMNLHETEKHQIPRTNSGIFYQNIEFDIATSAESTSDSGGKVGVKVLALTAGLGTNLKTNNSAVSRIKFHVPFGLPTKKKIS